jgi:hypothetical protein
LECMTIKTFLYVPLFMCGSIAKVVWNLNWTWICKLKLLWSNVGHSLRAIFLLNCIGVSEFIALNPMQYYDRGLVTLSSMQCNAIERLSSKNDPCYYVSSKLSQNSTFNWSIFFSLKGKHFSVFNMDRNLILWFD